MKRLILILITSLFLAGCTAEQEPLAPPTLGYFTKDYKFKEVQP